MTPKEQEELRAELADLRRKRDMLISELGTFAQESNDLRENSAYLHTEQVIHVIDSQIAEILREFGKFNLAKKKAAYKLKKPRKSPKVDL
jgi:transcription elongation GreA/GreB family factor